MVLAVVGVIIGAALVGGSAEALVRGGARLALAFRVSSLIVGLTVVAYGTSAPEAIVSVMASLRGVSDLAIGNVLGSNIANIGLIIGTAALMSPLILEERTVRTDLPLVLVVSVGFVLLAIDGTIARWEGILLLSGALTYTLWCISSAYREAQTAPPAPKVPGSRWVDVVLVAAGLVGLAAGAHLLVEGATVIAKALGVSELVIGVTIVAIGTSLPELAASVVASYRQEAGLSVGNVIGSNLFNLMLVIGLAATITPIQVAAEALTWDAAPMLLMTLVLLWFAASGRRVSRREGVVLLLAFVAYLTVSALRQKLGWVG